MTRMFIILDKADENHTLNEGNVERKENMILSLRQRLRLNVNAFFNDCIYYNYRFSYVFPFTKRYNAVKVTTLIFYT